MIPLISGICTFDIYSNKTETKLECAETIFSYIFLIIVVLVVGYIAHSEGKRIGGKIGPQFQVFWDRLLVDVLL